YAREHPRRSLPTATTQEDDLESAVDGRPGIDLDDPLHRRRGFDRSHEAPGGTSAPSASSATRCSSTPYFVARPRTVSTAPNSSRHRRRTVEIHLDGLHGVTMLQRTPFAPILWSSCLAMFAVGANSTAIMAALPSMRTELVLSSAGVEWAVNAYLVVSAAFIVLGGQ